MRGRIPKPVETKEVGGNAGKRKLPAEIDLPKVAGEPPAPRDFQGDRLDEWRRLVADLHEAGTLGRENGAAMEIYVRNLVRMREAEEHVLKHGVIVPAPRTGVPMHNPFLTVANAAAKVVKELAVELGLTPSSRGRVSKIGGKEGDPDDAFFGGAPETQGPARPH